MLSDRDLVNNWLTTRNFDDEDRKEVMRQCEQDPKARSYWVAYARELHGLHRIQTITQQTFKGEGRAMTDDRTIEQNKVQWPILQAFAEQLQWPVNGHMVHMTKEDWKDVLTAAFRKETVRLAAGLEGGVVMLGLRTSKFKVAEFSEWIDFLNYVAADRGIKVPAPEWMYETQEV